MKNNVLQGSQKRDEGYNEDKKVHQANIFPSSVVKRHLGNMVFGSPIRPIAATTTDTGVETVFTITLTQNDNFELVGHLYTTLYVDNILPTHALPGGSSIDESQWQIIGPYYDHASWEEGSDIAPFPKNVEYAKFYVRNISAGPHVIGLMSRWRYIAPREA